MNQLKVNPEELRSIGNSIKTNGESFVALLNQIKNNNNNLQSAWTGEDADKYTTKIQEQTKVMDNLAEAIDDIGTFLVQIASAYESAKEEAKNTIK